MIELGAEYTYKGKLYKTISLLKFKTESGWKDGILYQALYLNQDNLFVRDIEDFKTYFKQC